MSHTHQADPYPSREGDASRIILRDDPVVYSNWNELSPLTGEQTSHYERFGHVDIQLDLSTSEIDRLVDELNRLKRERALLPPETVITEPGSQALRSIFFIHEVSEPFRRLLYHRQLVHIARFLLGDDVYIHQSRLNYKPGFRGKEFYWHSDFETWHVEDGMPRMRALSMSIALTPNTEFNGPLMLVPGSHRMFVGCVGETPADHYKQSLMRQEYGVPDEESLNRLICENGIVTPKGPIGSVTIFDSNILHGSNGNITPHARSNLFVVYNSYANRLVEPFGRRHPRPEFLAARIYQEPIAHLYESIA